MKKKSLFLNCDFSARRFISPVIEVGARFEWLKMVLTAVESVEWLWYQDLETMTPS